MFFGVSSGTIDALPIPSATSDDLQKSMSPYFTSYFSISLFNEVKWFFFSVFKINVEILTIKKYQFYINIIQYLKPFSPDITSLIIINDFDFVLLWNCSYKSNYLGVSKYDKK